jgi:Mrp family chromosome partitioning ATPase
MAINSSNCDHDCSSCGENCADRDPKSFLVDLNEFSKVGKVFAVVSGKGGVGKSLVTGLSAVASQKMGKKTAILDADITGPSVPQMFGLEGQVLATRKGIEPATTKSGIKVLSANLVLENPRDPVVWRAPVITGVITQFWNEAHWDDIDVMFVDMPPGTGDVPLTVFQSLPVDGIIVVTSPQDLVSMIVEKALRMAQLMNVPVLGIVENMSYVKCPDCGKEIKVFGESNIDAIAKGYGTDVLAKFPIDAEFASLCDAGRIEEVSDEWLGDITAALKNAL